LLRRSFAAQLPLSGPGIALGNLEAVAVCIAPAESGRGERRSKKRIIEGGHLRIARLGRFPGGDRFGQRRVAGDHLLDQGFHRQLLCPRLNGNRTAAAHREAEQEEKPPDESLVLRSHPAAPSCATRKEKI